MHPTIHCTSHSRWSLAAGWLSACLLAAGCNPGASKAPPTPPIQAVFTLPVVQEVTNYEEFTGRTDAINSVDVRAMVTGYLNKVFFTEGMEVKQNAPLFEIDQRTYRAELDRAEAILLQAQAHLKRLESDYRRAQNLVATKSISQEDFDKVAGDRDEALAAVKLSEAAMHVARLNFDFTTVRAYIGGRISRRMIDPGNMVKANETVLTTIVEQDPIYAYFDVDERTVLKVRRLIREGKVKSARETEVHVMLAVADEQGFPHEGTINFIDNRLDASAGTLRLRGLFANPKNLLSPGMFARVRVPIGTPHEAILVPEQALGSDQGQKFVYVLNDKNEAQYRRVETGALVAGLRVIENGISTGERVITSGLQKIRPGVPVEAKQAGK